ncbi:MAG: chemotaxis protein CheW, partial [Acidobacteriota bacterium]
MNSTQAVESNEPGAQIAAGRQLGGKYMTFKLASEEYGLEILKVRDVIGLMEITRVPKAGEFIRGVIPEYQQFWEALRRGEAQVDEFKRLGKGGKEVWLQASYTPIKDLNSDVFKVVKYATNISENKETIKDIATVIAAASEEQSKGIDQVNKAVAEMDKVVQQSAANSEESSSAAEELSGQSQELVSMVDRFELSRNADGRKAAGESHRVASRALQAHA